MAKLSIEKGREIRIRHSKGESIRHLSACYGVGMPTIKGCLTLRLHSYNWTQAVTDEQWDWLCDQATAEGISVPEYIRRLVKRAMQP